MPRTAALLASSKPRLLERCLSHATSQTTAFDRVVVVVWGEQQDEVREVIDKHRGVQAVPAQGDDAQSNTEPPLGTIAFPSSSNTVSGSNYRTMPAPSKPGRCSRLS